MTRPPQALMRAHRVASPHGGRDDVYYWLRDDSRTDADVLAYLQAENQYTDTMLAPVKPLIDHLYTEIVARLKQDDATVPVRDRGYWYAVRYAIGQEYPIVVRWADAAGKDGARAEEVILLDGNALAAGQSFFQLGGYEVSPDNRLLAYTEDSVGRRQYRLRIKDLVTGTLLPDVIENVEATVAW
ncbi:MAG: S9 family peptidase, partial [Pseudomonadota bacterium]|nr:S9 family peptidase [Pseudomonadota bacterium]